VANLSLRETLRRWVPSWASDQGTGHWGFRFLYAFAWICDIALEVMIQGVWAAFPEHGTPTALAYHGRDRRIFRGPFAGAAYYAAQLVEWLTFWRSAGSSYVVAKALQTFLAPNAPMIRVVGRGVGSGATWWTLDTDGTLTRTHSNPNNWDWDSLTHPGNSARWWDFWVIVYQPSIGTDGDWGDPGDWGDDGCFGNDLARQYGETIKALIRQWKGAHAHPVCLIWSYDPALFDPSSGIGAGINPDGYFGYWSKVVGGVEVKARFEDARYWEIL
jgi:hypothetical protein